MVPKEVKTHRVRTTGLQAKYVLNPECWLRSKQERLGLLALTGQLLGLVVQTELGSQRALQARSRALDFIPNAGRTAVGSKSCRNMNEFFFSTCSRKKNLKDKAEARVEE